jgi:hypothetical protein
MKQISSRGAGAALTGPSAGLVIEEGSKGLAAAVIAVLVPSLIASRRVILLLIRLPWIPVRSSIPPELSPQWYDHWGLQPELALFNRAHHVKKTAQRLISIETV